MISTNKNSFPNILNVFGFYSIFAWYLEILSITAYEDQVVGMGWNGGGGGLKKIGKVSDTKKKQVVKHFIANITSSTNWNNVPQHKIANISSPTEHYQRI